MNPRERDLVNESKNSSRLYEPNHEASNGLAASRDVPIKVLDASL